MSQAKHREVSAQRLQTSFADRIDSKCLTDRDLAPNYTGRSGHHKAEQSRQRFYFTKARLLALIICLTACFPLVALTQSADEATFGSIVKSFFESYQKEDIGALMKLWSEKSPEAASARKSFEQTFAANDKIEVKSLTPGKMKADGEKASLRIVVEMSAVEGKTGKTSAGFGKQNRTFHFVKEGGDWKVWQYVSSEEELAAALVAAKTEEKRKALLEADKELMTVKLPRSLNSQARRLFNRGKL